MKKGSTDELKVIVKPTMTGRHALLIRILDRLILQMDFESTPGLLLENDAWSILLMINHV